MVFVHNLDPIIFSIGPLAIRWYSLPYILGFILVYFFLDNACKHKRLNVTRDDIESYLLWLIIGVIVFSRLIHVLFWNPAYYFSDPVRMLMIWKGGLAFHGGLIGAAVATYWFSKKHKIPFFKLADILTIPAIFVLALGRVANFINGELWGTVTGASWCVQFKHAEGCRHPVQLYGALGRFALFGTLLFLGSKKHGKKHRDGFIFWTFVFLVGIGRFAVDFLREDARFLMLSAGQYLSIAMVLIAGYILFTKHREDVKVLL